MLNEPQNILERLAAADREHQKEAAGRFLLRAVKYVGLAMLLMFAGDVALHLEAGWRLVLLLLLLLSVAALFVAAWQIGFVHRNRLEHIARFLETRDSALGSRLINLLQLQEQARDASLAPLTRNLARQAVEGYSAGLRNTPLERLAWTGELSTQLKRAAWAVLGVAAVMAAFFRVTAVELARFADPYGDHPPYSFTRLEIVTPGPEGTNVLYGKGLVIRVKASGHQPKDVFLTVLPGGESTNAFTLPMFDKGKLGYDQLVDNIRTGLVIVAHTKDKVSVSKQARIGVALTPKLDSAFVRIAPPAYTGLKTDEKPYTFKPVQALEGSEVRFRFRSNRPLREGVLEISGGEQQVQKIEMRPSAEQEVAGSFIAKVSGRLRFAVTDIAGLPSQDEWEGALTVTHDLAPEIRITEPERDALVAMDFKLQAHIEARDDYGLKAIRIHRGLNGVYSAPRVVTFDSVTRESNPAVDFSFADLGIKPDDVISLYAEALDTAPEAHLARSQTVRFFVISVEAYNNYLRERSDISDAEAKYSELIADLEELIEKQRALGEAAGKMKQQADSAKAQDRENLVRQLDDLLGKQNELNQRLDQHADRMEEFVRQNPLYDVEEEFKKLLHEQAENIRQSIQTNNAVGRDVAQRSSPPSGPRQASGEMAAQLKKASDEQVERLAGVKEEGEKEMAKTLQDMSQMQELLKDFNQFEALFRTQEELAAQAQAYDRPGPLSREDQLALKELAATQKEVGDLLEQLEQKLREDAKTAEKLFPKAAKSAETLADNMNQLRLQPLAKQATSQMLAGNGERSSRTAERLRSEMEKLFSECQGGNCPSGNELDSYLSLQRGLNAGKSFSQMAQSQKFGKAKGQGMGLGMGQGMGGSGYSVVNGNMPALMGNEKSARQGSATARQSSQAGNAGTQVAEKKPSTKADPSDVIKNLNPANRQSGAVDSGAVIEEYSDLVDRYFQAITTKKKP